MQDEVNEKIIALCVQTTRMSTGVLKASMRKFLDGMSRQKQKRVQVKQAVKTGKAQEKGKTGCQNGKSTGKGQRKRKKTTGDEKASWKADDKTTDRTGSTAYKYSDHGSKYQVI